MEKEEIFSEIRRLNNLGYKDSQIAKQLGIKLSTVNYYRHRILKLQNNNGFIINKYKNDILKMWANDYTLIDICKHFGISYERLHTFLKNENLSTQRKVKNRKTIKRNIGPREKGILLGMFLGDGTIYKNKTVKYKNGVSRFTVRHCMKQKKYCEYIYNCLKHLNPKIKMIKIKGHIYNDKIFKDTYQTEVRFVDNTFLNDLYTNGYIDGKKCIPFNLFQYYNREALAFHFMDDGCKITDKSGEISGFILCTDSFSYNEVLKFSYFLKGKFNLNPTVNCLNNNYYRIRINKKDVKRFIYLIEPYIIENSKYKISPNKIQ